MTKAERIRAARGFVFGALDGAINHSWSDYDPIMMGWSKQEHHAVMTEVGRIRDKYRRSAVGARLAQRSRGRT